jgi:predicted extracellular nuclease
MEVISVPPTQYEGGTMLEFNFIMRVSRVTLTVGSLLISSSLRAECISLTSLGATYSQNFDTLAASGTENPLSIPGWSISESDTNADISYAVSRGSSSAGNTYSFGPSGSSDRALGGLLSSSLIPLYGACFTNNTGTIITELNIAYTGEEWRLGGAARTDQINFEYSTNATHLNNGTWTGISALNFVTPVTTAPGAHDGNARLNRQSLSSTLASLNIGNGATFWIRWIDSNANNADDGLAVDDFSLTPTSTASTPSLTINDISLNEGNSGTTDYVFTASLSSPAPLDGVRFTIATADGTATGDNDFTSRSLTDQTIPAGSTTYDFTVAVTGDSAVESDETFTVNISSVTGATLVKGQGTGTLMNDDISSACSTVDTPIGQIQGFGASAALAGTQTVQGVVVGDYEGISPTLRGFYLQNLPAGIDNDPATSDAIFVYNPANDAVSLGQIVQVTGTVGENQGQTQISSPTIVNCGGSGNITPVDVKLPIQAANGGVDYWERYEGMLVRFPQPLYVTEHFQLGRFGQIVVSADPKLPQPTHVATPGASALAQQAANSLNRFIVDDALQNQNPDPIVFGRGGQGLTASNTLRGGDTVTNLTGVMTYTWSGNSASGNAFRLRPINALNAGVPNFIAANPRPSVPAQVNGHLKVASANLLNFFNTFTHCTNGVGGMPSTQECRGTDSQAEFDRQWPKTVENLVGTGAAVIVVNEMENDGYGSNSAIQFLVDKMNAKAGAGTYAFINPDPTHGTNALGTDYIKVGMLYKPGIVKPVGNTAVLNTGAMRLYQTNNGPIGRNRPSLAQAFEEKTTGKRFITVANHFKSKSKSSACDSNTGFLSPTHSTTAIVADTDAGDGQGTCNKTRTAAAEELMFWLTQDPTGTGESDILVMGDLNSYAMEDPINVFKNHGYTNLIEKHIGSDGYSYAFDGEWGYLDHALASFTMAAQVQGVVEWHINADEPTVLDYNTESKSTSQLASLYAADAFRTSDHDPIIIGLTLD